MSLINDLKRTFLNASKVIVDKTGDYSRIARLSLEDKKYEQTDAGKYVLECMRKGDSSINLNEKVLTDALEEIKLLEEKIGANKEEIEKLKKSEHPEEKNDDTGTD